MPKPKRPAIFPVSTLNDGWKGRYTSKPLANKWGECDYTNKEIVISKDTLSEGNVREIIIHEMLHKLYPFLDEEWVASGAAEIDFALERMLPDGF